MRALAPFLIFPLLAHPGLGLPQVAAPGPADGINDAVYRTTFTASNGTTYPFAFLNAHTCDQTTPFENYKNLDGQIINANWIGVKNDYKTHQFENARYHAIALVESYQDRANKILQRLQSGVNVYDPNVFRTRFTELFSFVGGTAVFFYLNQTGPTFNFNNPSSPPEASAFPEGSKPDGAAAAIAFYVTNAASAMLEQYNAASPSLRTVDLLISVPICALFDFLLKRASSNTQHYVDNKQPYNIDTQFYAFLTTIGQDNGGLGRQADVDIQGLTQTCERT